jgi:hypothetical protein
MAVGWKKLAYVFPCHINHRARHRGLWVTRPPSGGWDHRISQPDPSIWQSLVHFFSISVLRIPGRKVGSDSLGSWIPEVWTSCLTLHTAHRKFCHVSHFRGPYYRHPMPKKSNIVLINHIIPCTNWIERIRLIGSYVTKLWQVKVAI